MGRRLISPIAMLIALLLSACGMPGTSVEQPPATAVQQISDSAIEATVQARLAMTEAARQPGDAQATAMPAQTMEPAATTIATEPPSHATPTAAAAPAAGAAPDAVLAIGRSSLSVLGPEGWSQPVAFAVDSECGSSTAAFSGSGIAYAGCASRIYTTASGSWAEDNGLLNTYQAFSDPAGRVWIFGHNQARIIDGANVTTFDAQTSVGEDSFSISAAAFAPDGTAYFAQTYAENELVSFDGKSWKQYGKDLGLSEYSHPNTLLVTAKGELLVGSSEGLYKLDGDKFAEVLGYQKIADDIGYPASNRFTPEINTLAETPDGVIWFGTKEQGLFSWDGSSVTAHDRTKGLPANEITDLAIDAKGRLWVATTYGLALRDGEAWQIAEPDTSDLADSYITHIAVRGAPQLPAPAQNTKTAAVVGQVIESNTPLPGATVTLCSEQSIVGEETRYSTTKPCENHRFVANVKTDAQGNYRFDDVPLGTYSILIADNTKGQMIKPVGLFVVVLTPDKEVTQDLGYDG
jgi:hypothetical protein